MKVAFKMEDESHQIHLLNQLKIRRIVGIYEHLSENVVLHDF